MYVPDLASLDGPELPAALRALLGYHPVGSGLFRDAQTRGRELPVHQATVGPQVPLLGQPRRSQARKRLCRAFFVSEPVVGLGSLPNLDIGAATRRLAGCVECGQSNGRARR